MIPSRANQSVVVIRGAGECGSSWTSGTLAGPDGRRAAPGMEHRGAITGAPMAEGSSQNAEWPYRAVLSMADSASRAEGTSA